MNSHVKQYIVNCDCSSWYNRVILMLMWERSKEILHSERSAYNVSQNKPTLEYEPNGNKCYGG